MNGFNGWAKNSLICGLSVKSVQSKEDRRVPMIGIGTLNISTRAKELVLDALNNNRLSYGPLTERFENEFARIHTCRFGLMSNGGTSALQIGLQAMKELHGWQDGDEVIVPAVTFVATVNIVLHNRMQPVLVDVDPVYYELNPELVESRIPPRTRAIIPVHLFGQPADMKVIREIANRHGLKIIEDSAETMFASYDGQMVGSPSIAGADIGPRSPTEPLLWSRLQPELRFIFRLLLGSINFTRHLLTRRPKEKR